MRRIIERIFAAFRMLSRSVTGMITSPIAYFSTKLRYSGLVRFNSSVRIGENSCFEGADSIGDDTYFCGSMGYGSYIMDKSCFIGSIGRFTSIGQEFRNVQGIHPFEEPFATTSPMFYSLRKQTTKTFADRQLFDEMRGPIEIGNDCWIGCRVFASGGLTIGDGAVVLSGAVLTKDVPPYAVVGGVPAKVLRYRYDQETIDFLLETKWWEKPIPWIQEHWEAFSNIEDLKQILTA